MKNISQWHSRVKGVWTNGLLVPLHLHSPFPREDQVVAIQQKGMWEKGPLERFLQQEPCAFTKRGGKTLHQKLP